MQSCLFWTKQLVPTFGLKMIKFLSMILLVAFGVYSVIETRSIQYQYPSDIVDLKLYSASLNRPANASANVYAINSPKLLPLPINQTIIANLTYVEYITATSNRTAGPVWNNLMRFSSYYFNLNSYIAIELWNQTTQSTKQYLGGSIFTVGQLEHFPTLSQLILEDVHGRSIGTVLIAWTGS